MEETSSQNPIIITNEVVNLKVRDVRKYSTEELSDRDTLEILNQKATELLVEYRTGEAKEFGEVIGEIKNSVEDQSFRSQYAQIQAMFIIASFLIQPAEVQKKVIRENLLHFIKQGVQVKEIILSGALNLFDDKKLDDYRRDLLLAVSENNEQLGEQPLSQWIVEYNEFTKNKEDRKKVDEVNFISGSTKAQTSSEGDKILLLSALDIYDWLRFPRADQIAVAQPGTQTQQIKRSPVAPPVVSKSPMFQVDNIVKPKVEHQPIPKQNIPKIPLVEQSAFKVDKILKPEVDQRPIPKQGFQSSPQVKPNAVQVDKILKPSVPAEKEPEAPTTPLVDPKPLSNKTVSAVYSLSQAIAAAGEKEGVSGKVQMGQMSMSKPKEAFRRPNPSTVAPSPRPSETKPVIPARGEKLDVSEKPQVEKKNLPMDLDKKADKVLGSLPTAPVPEKIIDLSKRQGVNIAQISNLQELEKIDFEDLKKIGFNEGITQIKQKIDSLVSAKQIPVKQLAESFYRSPIYKLYVSIGTAVMQDQSGDQAQTFEKVINNYKSAGKDYLNREQFLAVNKLRKELKGLVNSAQ
ncbi:MAG: hypothetical protein COT91_02440 [Candidatus Doudnabacteria bacterium CG10_big_fil_rev_8_21_14_0_10_41_10]|uniref:Uncharacterized protein n=1 Tax=Candidatus Doudnabacteria bacterium CG10_big_fil_rev_8_21_14_0_10_41_10 TaxID=1974551 RepID=A0A2H0VFW4_9BACT|nr:MAG: hypothetical protein COT91_02440 [Candidatus Doudnabacteria bacterium CG10_big_fil_rev_8_21_14_0_10_41_10]